LINIKCIEGCSPNSTKISSICCRTYFLNIIRSLFLFTYWWWVSAIGWSSNLTRCARWWCILRRQIFICLKIKKSFHSNLCEFQSIMTVLPSKHSLDSFLFHSDMKESLYLFWVGVCSLEGFHYRSDIFELEKEQKGFYNLEVLLDQMGI
jgi:hypothetical protein